MKKWFRNMPLNGKILFIMIAGILIPFCCLERLCLEAFTIIR